MTGIPDEAITAAAAVLHDEDCDDGDTSSCGRWNSKVPGGYDPRQHIGYYEDRARAALEAAAPLIEAAERQRVYDQLGHDHYVIFTDDGWTVEHSVECRLAGDMVSGCAYWTALKNADLTSEPHPEMLGRWRIEGIDSEGLPNLVREPPEGTPS